MSGPTENQIKKVQTNLDHMADLNQELYLYGKDLIESAWRKLEFSGEDLGHDVLVNVIGAAVGYYAGGKIGARIGATVFNTLMKEWAAQKPSSLPDEFDSYLDRFRVSSKLIGDQLAAMHDDVRGNWDKPLTGHNAIYTLSHLADVDYPPRDSVAYRELLDTSLMQMDRAVWRVTLERHYYIYRYVSVEAGDPHPGTQSNPPTEYAKRFYGINKNFYLDWVWHDSDGFCDHDGWVITEYCIASGETIFGRLHHISAKASEHLFRDSIPGEIINEDGLFERAAVFTEFDMRQRNHHDPLPYAADDAGAAAPDEVSKEFLLAAAKGEDALTLIRTEGRASIEARIRARAKDDPAFARALVIEPHRTLEAFLGVRIPETLRIVTVQEDTRTLGIVVPPIDVSRNTYETLEERAAKIEARAKARLG